MATFLPRLASWWSFVREPSLVRSLLLAQLPWMLGLWLVFIALIVWVILGEGTASELNRRLDLLLGVVDTLADDPDRLRRSLGHIDRFLSSDNAIPDKP